LGAAAAALGLALGATLASHGPMLAMTDWLTKSNTSLSTSIEAAVLLSRGTTIVALLALIAVGLTGRTRAHRGDTWPWPVTGVALGVVGLLAWVSGSFAGWGWGLSITGPSRSLLESTILRMPGAAGWGTALVVGIPLGTWLSARARGPVSWRAPGWRDLGRRLGGGLLMGVGGTLAAGCNIGNALTGLSVLAVNSAIATVAIVAGAAVAIGSAGIPGRIPGLHLVRGQR
jgi:hypothetical protein